MWYQTRGANYIPEDKPLSLETDDNKILSNWYKANIKPNFDFENGDNLVKYLSGITTSI